MPMYLLVKGKVHGKHHWPYAPEAYAALRKLHEHDFGFAVMVRVLASREIEFLDFSYAIARALRAHLEKYPASSCEDLAWWLGRELVRRPWALQSGQLVPPLAETLMSVEVNEDSMCGALYVPLSQPNSQPNSTKEV